MQAMPEALFRTRLQAVVVAVGSRIQLRDSSESRIRGRLVRKRRKTALAHGLIAVDLRRVGLLDRSSTDVLSPKVNGIANLVFQPEAPLHEVWCAKFTIWHSRDRDRLQTGSRICKRRSAGKLAGVEAIAEGAVRSDHRIHCAVRHTRR